MEILLKGDFMVKTKISSLEAIMLILTLVISHSILSLPNEILTKYNSASLLNLLYLGIIATLISLLIVNLFKHFPGLDIVDISNVLGGTWLRNAIGITFIIYFILTSSVLLRDFCESIKIIYYPITNITFIVAFVVIAVCIANSLNFNATIKTNRIILPLALISIVFLFITNINNFRPQRIFPILGSGFFNTFILGLSNIASFGGIAYLYFLPPLLKNPTDFKKIAVTSMITTTVYLIFTVATLLFIFSFFLNISEISPLYNATRYIEFGSFFQRLESVFLLIWILVFTCYLSISLKMATYIFQKLTNLNDSKTLVPILGLLTFGIAIIPNNLAISQFFENNIYPSLMIGIVLFLSLGILILANFYKKRSNTQKSSAS